MTGTVIKEFLVGLGFDIDDAGLAKFNNSILTATKRVGALATAISAAAAGIVYGISKISQSFEDMGYEYHIIAPAINKALLLRRELLKAYSAAGINITKVIQASVKLNFSLNKTKFAFEAIYKSVASKFFGLITKQSDLLRQKLYANLPKIQAALEKFVNFIFKAFEAVSILGQRLWSILGRVYDFFVKLHKATDGWSTVVLAVVAAWEALNLAFLASPLGLILAGLLAILALYDDFKTFEEGGKSFFNWGPAIPIINSVIAVFQSLKDILDSIFTTVFNLVAAFWKLIHLDFKGAFANLADAIDSSIDRISKLWGLVSSVAGVFQSIGQAVGFDPGGPASPNVAANIQNNPVGSQVRNPIGSNVQNSQVSQKLNQQTTISVQSSADANAVGNAVAGQQTKVNQDLSRNMKGATR